MHLCTAGGRVQTHEGQALILLNGASGCRVLEAGERQEGRDAGVVSWVGCFGGAELSQGKCQESLISGM